MASNSESLPPPPVLAREHYDMWAAKMRTYLRAQSLWETVENGSNPAPLPDKPVATLNVVNEKLSMNDGVDKADDSVYRSIIGSLFYLSATRPDIVFAASLLSRFTHSPSQIHFCDTKRVVTYIRGITDYNFYFLKTESGELQGYADSDWAGSVDDAKGTSDYAFSFVSIVFSWNSSMQDVVAQSSTKAEYISAAAAANQAICLRKILLDVGQIQDGAIVIWVDNKSAICIANNPIQQ